VGERGEPSTPSSARTELIDFTIERQRHRRFVGREDVLAQLDEWLIGPSEAGWVVVTGGPGMGKSAVLSAWLARREAAGAAVPHHFVRRQVANWDQPEVIAASLAAQIEAMFPTLRVPEARPEGRLIELLGRVSKHLGAAGRLVVLVDGLDETLADSGDNPLPRFLPHVVPAGIRLLCAMRPTYPHLNWIEARSPTRRIDLDDRRWAASNEAVVRGFWQAAATKYEPPLPNEMIATAIDRADGNVLHAVMLHDALQSLPAQERRADQIPRGLGGLIGEIWDRAAVRPGVRAGLGLLCAAQEALSLDMIAELAGWGPDVYEERKRFLREARQLLLEEPASWSGAVAYRPRHDWVRELMAEQLGAATLRAQHGMLSRKLATWPAPAEASARRYALRHALIHRAEAGAWADAWHLAADMGFLEAKCRELGAHEAEADVTRAAERCHASGDAALRRRFDDLARALGRESHWIRAAPEATAALLWNRLRQSGWSTDEIEQQVQIPVGSKFLRVRHLATRESPALVRDLVGHADWVTACAVTPDGRRMVSASDDQTLKVWDLESGRVLATLEGHADRVTACAVTPDGRQVVSASSDQTLKVWDLASGCVVATLTGHADGVTGCAATPDGRRVVSASLDQTLKVWDLASGRALATLEGHADRVNACAVTPDGRRVVSASLDQTLKVWDLASERAVATLEGHTDRVNACAVTPDGHRVVSVSSDQTLKVWDLDSGHALATLEGHADRVNACAVTPDSRRVVSASSDKTLKVWNLESGRAVATLEGHASWVTGCAMTPDGRRVVSASDDKILKVWDLESGHALATRDGHAARVTACAVTPDSRQVVSASWDQTLRVWNLESGRAVATLEGHAARVNACAVTPDGQRVVSASSDKTLKVWNLATGRTVATLADYVTRMTACAVTPDGQRVVSASSDQTLRVWDLASGRAVATLEGHAARVPGCAVTPDGRRVVSASLYRTLKVWDLESGRVVATLEGHADRVNACAVTPDGRRVVSASSDKTLKVWDLESGRAVATLEGHADRVNACAVTPDGQRVVSASSDKTLKVWDLEAGACVLTHRANAAYTAVTTATTAIIAGDAVGSVWFFDCPSPNRRERSNRDDRRPDNKHTPCSDIEILSQRPPMKHTILFLAANPLGTDRLALDREARAIQVELERSGFRDRFELVTRWAAEPLDLLRELRKLKPTIVHFSGHGASGTTAGHHLEPASRRDVVGEPGHGDEPRHGLFFQSSDGRPQLVSTAALEETFGAAGASVKLVVLSACYSEPQAEALLAHVDCVVGMSGSLSDDAARSFAIGFYGGLGERESVAAAFKQGCAAISLEGLREADRPQIKVRAGIDAARLVLAAALRRASEIVAGTGPAASQPSPGAIASSPPRVDIGILTIRDDEFGAVLDVFPSEAGIAEGKNRKYALRRADTGNGQQYTIAVLRQVEQGHGEAQAAARDLIDDVAPKLVLVVGIAGGLPSDDVKLGDVVLSTRIQDFTVEARKHGKKTEYAVKGGPVVPSLAADVAILAARKSELGNWTAGLPSQPVVEWTPKGQLYGPPKWRKELRAKLEHHYGAGSTPRGPVFVAGPIASSDRLVKDPDLVIPWLATSRDLLAVEMESGGVYRAAQERCPMLAIRGISDIVGLKRADAWTKYACASAAAFTRAFLRTRPVSVGASASDPQ